MRCSFRRRAWRRLKKPYAICGMLLNVPILRLDVVTLAGCRTFKLSRRCSGVLLIDDVTIPSAIERSCVSQRNLEVQRFHEVALRGAVLLLADPGNALEYRCVQGGSGEGYSRLGVTGGNFQARRLRGEAWCRT
jgi:hypothetical protein